MSRMLAPRLRHADDWRALTTLNTYRCLIAVALVGALFHGTASQLFDLSWPALFSALCLAYLAQCGAAIACNLLRWPALRMQVGLLTGIDILCIAGLTFAGAGVASGLGMLLIAPVAAAGMLLSARIAGLLAALATLAILTQEALRPLYFEAASSEFVQAGILGALFFIAAALSQWLARRLRTSEALAAARATEVRDLAELNRRIIQQMQIGAVVIGANGRIQLINRAAARLLELSSASIQGMPLDEASPMLGGALRAWLRAPGNSPRTLQLAGQTLLPVFSRLEAAPQAPVLIFLEDAMRQSEQAQQLKLVALGRLTASIAHEIRNPLGAISHAGQLLAESPSLHAEDKKLLAIVHRHSQRINAIVTDVLGLSRRADGDRRPLALAAWLHETIVEYRQYNKDAPAFSLRNIAADLQVEFDPAHLRQVLFNLWHNAERYARRPGTPLRVTLIGGRSDIGAFYLDVADNGPGIGPGIAEHILEPFFTTARDGTGLGLHVARELCESNGARLTPAAGASGACFRITFAGARTADAAESARIDSP